MSLALVRMIADVDGSGSTVLSDLAAGNDVLASQDIAKAEGFAQDITDPGEQQEAAGIIASAKARLANITPDEQAAAATSFATLDSSLVANASTLNSDPVYTATQGGFTSSAAAEQAKVDSGYGASGDWISAGLGKTVQDVKNATPSPKQLVASTTIIALGVLALFILAVTRR